jgi:hypothetical protein
MTRAPISQVEVESEILRLLEQLEEQTDQYEFMATDAAEKESAYKQAWNKDYINQKGNGPIKDREAWADYKNAGLHHEWKIAEALLKAKQQRLTAIRTSLDSLRTLSANVRNLM